MGKPREARVWRHPALTSARATSFLLGGLIAELTRLQRLVRAVIVRIAAPSAAYLTNTMRIVGNVAMHRLSHAATQAIRVNSAVPVEVHRPRPLVHVASLTQRNGESNWSS